MRTRKAQIRTPRILDCSSSWDVLEQRTLLTTVGFDPAGNLVVEGTEAAETVELIQSGPSEPVRVVIGGEDRGSFVVTGEIQITLLGGDDQVDATSLTRDFGVFVDLGEGNDSFEGGQSNDTVFGGSGDDLIRGNSGFDSLVGAAGDDSIFGGLGEDVIRGGSENDFLVGGDGHDVIFGGVGQDFIEAGRGDDFVDGSNDRDLIRGESGDDTILGGRGDDLIRGSDGRDLIDGQKGDDQAEGNNGDDTIFGGPGDDQLEGGRGSDLLDGQEGDDLLDGGRGGNQLVGGPGLDRYVFLGNDLGQEQIVDLAGDGQIRHRRFRADGSLAAVDRMTVDSEDLMGLLSLGGDDTVRILDGVTLGGLVDGGTGSDLFSSELPNLSHLNLINFP